jgi:hypothetical protein
MRWIKKGAIFSPDGKIPCMVSHATIPFVELSDFGTVRVYFSSRNIKGQSLPYCLDLNPDNLSEIISLRSEPILPLGELGTFDDNGIMPSCIINNKGTKYLYYIGWNPQVTVSYRLSIGLAISEDSGKTFSKFSKGPVCDRGINEPFFNTSPYVMIKDNIWMMWYISCTKWRIINNYPEPQYHVKYAESTDGITWDKKGIVCIDYDDFTEAIGRPCVIIEDGKFKMWYSYRQITNYRTSRDKSYRIGYAESIDGKNWERKDSQVGIEKSDEGWDSEMIEYCHVLDIDGRKHMFYNGNGFGKTGFGYAVLEE